jgi:inositol-pentakisphosphate 2-kinase
MPRDETEPSEIRLGDLDLKTGAGGKAKYWLDLEKQLISEGWYLGSKTCSHTSDCALQGFRSHSQPSI